MKIVLQHPHRPGEISGVVTFVDNAVRALTEAGHQVRLVRSAEFNFSQVREAASWADVIHLNSNDLRFLFWAKMYGRVLVQQYHYPFWGIWKKTSEHADLGLLGSAGRALAEAWSHGKGWRFTGKFVSYFGTCAARLFLRLGCAALADERVFPARALAIDAVLPGTYQIIHYGMDFAALEELSGRPLPETPRFIFVGRLAPEKGPQLIIEASALLRKAGFSFEVIIVGDGDQRVTLEARVRELGLAEIVKFPGKVAREEAMQRMADGTVVIVPSLWEDPSPFTVIEAAALRRAIIGTRRGGIPEIIGPGILLADEKPETLAAAMQKFLDRNFAVQRGKECHEFALRTFDNRVSAQNLTALYRSMAPDA